MLNAAVDVNMTDLIQQLHRRTIKRIVDVVASTGNSVCNCCASNIRFLNNNGVNSARCYCVTPRYVSYISVSRSVRSNVSHFQILLSKNCWGRSMHRRQDIIIYSPNTLVLLIILYYLCNFRGASPFSPTIYEVRKKFILGASKLMYC